MGTFISVRPKDWTGVRPDKKDVFIEQAAELFRRGGMVNIKVVSLYDRRICLLEDRYEDDDTLAWNYNIVEQEFWEDVCINKHTGQIHSEKVGYSMYNNVVTAAYILAAHYSDSPVFIYDWQGTIASDLFMTGWINQVLGESFPRLALDGWPIFELGYDMKDRRLSKPEIWVDYLGNGAPDGTMVDIITVCLGSKEAEKFISKLSGDGVEQSISWLKEMRTYIEECCHNLTPESFLRMLDRFFRTQEIDDTQYSDTRPVREHALLLKAPAAIVCLACEYYERNFWQLWPLVREGASLYREKEEAVPAEPKSDLEMAKYGFSEFSFPCDDDFIHLWSEEKPIRFSEDLENWCIGFRSKFLSLIDQPGEIYPDMPENICRTLSDAEEIYGNVYCFKSFFYESLEHQSDRRYQALWRIFSDMVHDESYISCSKLTSGKNRYKGLWDMQKLNPAHKRLRYFMAICCNRELRNIWFGF